MPNNLKELFRDELQNHAIVILQRTGNSITESFLMEGESFTDTTIKLNEVLDYKATEEDPTYHVKVSSRKHTYIILTHLNPTFI